MAVAGPVPSALSQADFPSPLNKEDAASPLQTQRHQSKQLPPENPSNSSCCPLTVCGLQKCYGTEEQTEKADYCRGLRLRWYFPAEPILAFHNTDELIGLTLMK